jgi:hypothetical protein
LCSCRDDSRSNPPTAELAHWVVANYKPNLQIFRKALFVYERGAQLLAEDKTGKWQQKAAQYKKDMAAGDPRYAEDTSHDELVAFLFPELFRSKQSPVRN